MKKNKMMRVASILLVAVLLTTSIISGTFAKYVTSGETGDQARVAKFGVTIAGSGSLFAQTYYYEGLNNTPGKEADVFDGTWSSLTVESSNGDNLVAPGTQNDEGMSLTVAGAPEVDVKVELKVDEASEDVFLAEGWFADRTTAALGDPFLNDEAYYPIVYTLTKGAETLKTGSLQEIKTFLDTYVLYVDANTVMDSADYTYTLTWAWDFDDEGQGTNDKQDTLLGDIAAYRSGNTCNIEGSELAEDVHYNIDVNVKISVTVTQVD